MSYTEFYDLVTDPDPGRPDFGKHGVTDEKVEAKKNAGDQMKRQRELEKREHLNEQLHEAQTKMERLLREAQQHRDEERPLHEQVTVT